MRRGPVLVIWLATLGQLSAESDVRPSPGISDSPRPIEAQIQPEAALAFEELEGFDVLLTRFSVERALLGHINMLPESVMTSLRTDSGLVLNGARWFNPLRNGHPELDWRAFLKLFDRADSVLARHGWLLAWRKAEASRSVELQAFALGPAETAEHLEFFVEPIWRHAEFLGEPEFSVLARMGNNSWLQLYFNDSDPRILVSMSMGLPEKPLHWLDSLDVSFHPRCTPGEATSKYAVIEPDGKWQVRQFPTCLPLLFQQ